MPRLSRIISPKAHLRFIVDHPWHVIALGIIITLIFAFQLPNLRFGTSIYDMVIEDLPETVLYESFKEEFGSEEMIFVVAKTDHVFEESAFEELSTLSLRLSGVEGVRRVISLPEIKNKMEITKKWNLSEFEKVIEPVELFQRNLISEDRKTTMISLVLEDIYQKDKIIDSVDNVLNDGWKRLTLYQTGMPLVSRALRTFTETDFLRLPPITFLVIAVILFIFFKNLRGILIPIGSVVIALIWTFGLMAWTGTPLSMMTIIVPVFIIAVGTAYCMYILPEFMEALKQSKSSRETAYICFTEVRFPTVLAVITTSIGLGSMIISRISAIRDFALFSCFGIWSMLVILIIFLPAVFSLLPVPPKRPEKRALAKDIFDPILRKIIQFNLSYRRVIFPVIAVIALLGIIGIFQIKVETNPISYFRADTDVSQNFFDISENMAGSFPINIVISSGEGSYFEDPDHLRMIFRMQRYLEAQEGVDKTISFVDYLQLTNYATNQYHKAYYAIPKEPFQVRMLINSYKSMLGQDMFERFMDKDISKANIMLLTHISSSRDFIAIKKRIERYLDKNYSQEVDIQVTGFGIVISESSNLLTEGQVKSLSITLVLIFLIMFFLFISFKVGLIAVLPNCFPIIVNFGLIGWLGIELSVITSLVAGIAIGLAVDDTIHYLVKYDREFKKDLDKNRTLQDTVLTIGKPIIFTTLTISIGFSILMFSQFKPTAVFGMMIVVTMVSAMAADLILLPSLINLVEMVTVWDLLRLKLGRDPHKGLPLLRGLSRTQVHYVLMVAAVKTFDAGETLFRKGEVSDSMYAIISGEMALLDVLSERDTENIHEAKRLIAYLKPGDVVGATGMVRSCRRSATVIATAPTELLQINDRMIRRLHWLYPPTAQRFFFNLMSIICDRLEYVTHGLSHFSAIDTLTGLQNREYFQYILEKEVDRSTRYDTDLSIFILDLDKFKKINADYKYKTGDFILAETGRFLLEQVRKSDLVCRYSGQQFGGMLVNIPSERARLVCDRIRQLLAFHAFEEENVRIKITGCIGFVSFSESRAKTAEALIEMAELALKEAKESGPDCMKEYEVLKIGSSSPI